MSPIAARSMAGGQDFPDVRTGVFGKSGRGEAAPAWDGRRVSSRGRKVFLSFLLMLVMVNLAGLPYYQLPTAERVRSPLHAWLKPTGYVGQSAGILSFLLFAFLWLYPLRKKFRWLAFTGAVSRWLDVHVAAGLSIPLLAAMHAAWHFTGLIGLGYGAMFIVCLSGIVGRYLYTRIPRGKDGLEMTLAEMESDQRALRNHVAQSTGIDPAQIDGWMSVDRSAYQGLGPLRTLARMVGDDFERWRAARRLRRGWLSSTSRSARRVDPRVMALVLRLARRQMALSQQVRMLGMTQRLFRYWHVAHRPVAVTALVAVLLHVAVAVLLGVTWFR